MKSSFLTTFLLIMLTASLYAQNGSINNTLGAAGTFTIKDVSTTFFSLSQSNGYVGIGTASPAALLHMNGPANSNRGQLTIESSAVPQLTFYSGPTTTTHLRAAIHYDVGGGLFILNNYNGGSYGSIVLNPSDGNVGIGTTSPVSKLDVTGQLTTDQIKVDGIPSFFATHLEQTNLDANPTVLSTWDEASTVVTHDNSGSFDASTGQFTVPRDGFYFLSAYIELSGLGSSGASLQVKSDGNFTQLRSTIPGNSGTLSITGVVKLLSGAVVTVVIFKPGSTGSCTAGAGYFSGYLVSDF